MWVPFANAKATHIFSAKMLAYIYDIFNDLSFKDTLTNDIVTFEQLSPELRSVRLQANKVRHNTSRNDSSPLLSFIVMFLIICVSLWCFTDEVEDPYADQTYICNWELHQNYGWGCASKTGLSPTHTSSMVFLLTVLRRFLCCISSLYVRLWFYIWSLCCNYLFLTSPSVGATGSLCFVIVAFLRFLNLYSNIKPSQSLWTDPPSCY